MDTQGLPPIEEAIGLEALSNGYDGLVKVVDAITAAENGISTFWTRTSKLVPRASTLRRAGRRRRPVLLKSTALAVGRMIDDCHELLKRTEDLPQDFLSAAAWIFYSYSIRRRHGETPTESPQEKEALAELRAIPSLTGPTRTEAANVLELLQGLPTGSEIGGSISAFVEALRRFLGRLDAVNGTAARTDAMIHAIRFLARDDTETIPRQASA